MKATAMAENPQGHALESKMLIKLTSGGVMALSEEFEHCVIMGKDIYVVEAHHQALAAWALVRRTSAQPPNLITIDHHTDTDEAFRGFACVERYEGRVDDEVTLHELLRTPINWKDDASLQAAISKLRHDEHIDAATLSGILNQAYCIQLCEHDGFQSLEQEAFDAHRKARWPEAPTLPVPTRPMTYKATAERIYVIPAPCYIGCTTRPHNDDCVTRHALEIVESRYLEDQLARGSEISRCFGLLNLEAAPYILDIDLDAFHCRKAITPDDPSTLHRLIRNAAAITIATEPECVQELWHDEDDRMDADELLAELMRHIDAAL